MVWIRRRYSEKTWATTPLFDQFERHFMMLGGPKEMLMVEEQHAPLDSTIWIRLPGGAHAAAYSGFEEPSSQSLPKLAILLIGHNAEFEKQFEYGAFETQHLRGHERV